MVAQLLVEGVELLSRGGPHHAGDAQVLALAAGAHLDRGGVEVGGVLAHDAGDRMDEAWLLAAHHLDREIAGKGERRAICYDWHGRCFSALGRNRFALAGPHYLLLELLVELVHAAEHRPRAAVADALAVELDDGEHFLRRGGDPDLV